MGDSLKPCIVYGSGEWGRQAYWEFSDWYEFLCYVDRNPSRWGERVYRVEIKSPEELARHRDALAIIAIDNDAGIEEYIRSFGVEKVIHYRYDAMTARKPALIYGTGTASIVAAEEAGERFKVCYLVGEHPVEELVPRLKVADLNFLQECSEAVLIVPEALADDVKLASLREIFSGDILKHIPGEGVFPCLPLMERQEARLFIDVTISRRKKQGEGVARVAGRLWAELKGLDSSVTPVRNLQGTLVTDYAYGGSEDRDHQVRFIPGDRLLLLDPSWPDYHDFAAIIARAQSEGAKVFAIVHDLIPAYMPELFSDSIRRPFFYWHDLILQEADGLVCVSRHTVEKAKEYVSLRGLARKNPPAYYAVHLGGDFKVPVSELSKVRAELKEFMDGEMVFLTVGTIEPRKGHQTIVNAFAKLRTRKEARLLILGHDGWLNTEIKLAIEQSEKGILWLKDATDAELEYAYEHAAALIAASQEEGFGLPLAEAACYGLPVICSDIEVFREVVGDNATYFSSGDGASLAREMEQHLSHKGKCKGRMRTWSETGKEFMEILTAIPRKIHFCWLSGEAYPPLVQKCLASWRKYLPGYEIKLWDKENSPLHDNAYIEEAMSEGMYAFASDYIRLYALYHEGGLYLDSDVEVMKDFSPLLMEPAFIGWERCGRVGPWLAASKAGNPVIKALLDEYETRHFLKDGKMDLTVNTIPTTRLLVEKGLQPEDEIQRISDFTIYPERYFCPKDPWTRELVLSEDTFAIHHFAGSWNKFADKDMPYIHQVPAMVESFLERYREQYHQRPIIVYGTGVVAFNIYKALKKHTEFENLLSFMVTRFDNAWRSYHGVPIVELKDAREWEQEPVVVIGTVERYHGGIRESLFFNGYNMVEILK